LDFGFWIFDFGLTCTSGLTSGWEAFDPQGESLVFASTRVHVTRRNRRRAMGKSKIQASRSKMQTVVRLVVGVYLGVLAVMYFLQSRLVFPGRETQGHPLALVRPRPGTELVPLTIRRGESIVALFGPALQPDGRPHPHPAGCPTLLFFYGNAMCLNYATVEFEQFRRLGLNVLIPEYVGYGMSSGSPSETGCHATADAAYNYLVSTRGVPPERIVVAGWSLGGAVAVDLASRQRAAGLIAFCTFTSGVDMGRRLVPFLPVSLLLRHRFDCLQKIARVPCPILIGHGRRDSIVPFRMGQRLAEAATSPVTTLWIDDADHNDFFDVGVRQIDEAMLRFIRSLEPAGS
jgi:pimeloyl-ACP methyl ester carboxylesterase